MKNNIDTILKLTTSDKLKIDEENEKLIIIDNKTGVAHNKRTFEMKAKEALGRVYNYYIVNYDEFTQLNDLDCEINDPKKGVTIKLKISIELSFIEGKALKAIRFIKDISNIQKRLQRTFEKWIRNYAVDHPNFMDDFFRLDEDLREKIVREAENKGIRIRILKLTPVVSGQSDFPPSHIKINHVTKCEILDNQIEVQNKIVLNLVNRRVFSWRNIESPKEWIIQKTNSIIQNRLINKSFKDVIDEFDVSLKNEISEELEREVTGIGYSIQHIISVPSKEIADFLNGFKFDIKGNETFATSDTEIKIKLGVTIEAKGTTISGVKKKFIKPRKSVINEVRKLTIETIASTLRGVQPEDCYTSFDTVKEYIAKEIRYALDDNFKLDKNEFKISIGFLSTNLKERFDKLFAERGTIHIESQSANTYYIIRYGVQAVNNWHVFQKNHIKYHNNTAQEYQDISDYLKHKIELDVKRIAAANMEVANSLALDNGISRLFKEAQYIITEEFGLQLKDPRLQRVSGSDLDDNEILAEVYLDKRQFIKEQLKEAIMADDDDLVEEFTSQLTKIGNNLKGIASSQTKALESKKDSKIDKNEEE